MKLHVNDDFMGVMSQKGGRALVHIMYIGIYVIPLNYTVCSVLLLLFIVKLNCPLAAVTHRYSHLQKQ